MRQTQRDPNEEQMTRLGYYGLIPFVFGAVAMWLVPLIAPQSRFPLIMGSMVLAYGGIITAYLAGVGAGGLLSGPRTVDDNFLPNMIAALVAFLAVWTNVPSGLEIPAAWRHVMVFIALIYLLLRDLRAVEAGNLPQWYGALRMRLTFWAGISILAVVSRLILSNHY